MMLSRRAVPGVPVCVPPSHSSGGRAHMPATAEPPRLSEGVRPGQDTQPECGSLLPWAGQAGPGTPAPETQPFPLKGSLGSRLNNFTV